MSSEESSSPLNELDEMSNEELSKPLLRRKSVESSRSSPRSQHYDFNAAVRIYINKCIHIDETSLSIEAARNSVSALFTIFPDYVSTSHGALLKQLEYTYTEYLTTKPHDGMLQIGILIGQIKARMNLI